MASKARLAFDQNAKDIKRLLEIHRDLGGSDPGRRTRIGVLNKSAIVLITSFWEAYCEDITAEALEYIVGHASSADALPSSVKKQVAKELEKDDHDLAVWALADQGWKDVLRSRLARMQEQRNRKLNAPRASNIDHMLEQALGLASVSNSWQWHKMTADRAREKLDHFVTLRGEIAHRGSAATGVRKTDVEQYINHDKRLVSKTGGRVNTHVTRNTGRRLW